MILPDQIQEVGSPGCPLIDPHQVQCENCVFQGCNVDLDAGTALEKKPIPACPNESCEMFGQNIMVLDLLYAAISWEVVIATGHGHVCLACNNSFC